MLLLLRRLLLAWCSVRLVKRSSVWSSHVVLWVQLASYKELNSRRSEAECSIVCCGYSDCEAFINKGEYHWFYFFSTISSAQKVEWKRKKNVSEC